MPDLYPTVQGRCPACRGSSLFLGSGGYVTCARADCPDPEAATRMLEQRIDRYKIRHIAPWRPACPEGRHVDHPGYTCDDAENLAAAGQKLMADVVQALDALDSDTPAALRGPNWRPQS